MRTRSRSGQATRYSNHLKLLALGMRSAGELIALCVDNGEEAQRRAQACTVAGDLRLERAVPALVQLASGQNEDLAWAASRALGRIGSFRATRALMRIASQSQSFTARQAAILALGTIGDPRAAVLLVKVLHDKKESEYLRGLAAQALGGLRSNKHSVPALIRALKDPSTEVRYSALCGLGPLRDGRALQPIENLTNDTASLPGEGTVGDLAKNQLACLTQKPTFVEIPSPKGRRNRQTNSKKSREGRTNRR